MAKKVLASGLDRMVHPINEVRSTVLNVPSKEQLALPFYNLLPKDPIELLRWKIYVRQRCLDDQEFRADIEAMCAQDVAFFAATFVWVFEPRPPRGIPFTPWCDQVDALAWVNECYETHRDLGCEKTRGIGWSYVVAIYSYWLWKYVPDVKIAYTTKDETTLDGPDANSFMGKVRYIHEHMPAWARTGAYGKDIMHRTMDQHLMINRQNGATLQGFPPTSEKVRSLRFSILINDEFAFYPRGADEALNNSVHTAPCRLFISTWHGHGNTFHTIMRVEKSTMLRIQSYWWNNPERWKGCYCFENGRLKIIDTDYEFPPDYPFVQDDHIRSPWVDFELSRAGSKKQSALEELYGLSAEAGRKLLRGDTLMIVQATVETPFAEGDIDTNGRETVFRRRANGPLKLYADIGEGRGGPFAAACDLGQGVGATPSTLEVIDLSTGKQVIDFADNEIRPVELAGYVVDVMEWLSGDNGQEWCFLDFEANGEQGPTFGNEIIRLGWLNVRKRRYKRPTKEQQADGSYLGTRNKDKGLAAISELERAILDGECVVVSEDVLLEMRAADKDDDGLPVFHGLTQNHGDRLQGLAICWGAAKDKLTDTAPTNKPADPRAEIENYHPTRKRGRSWRLNRGRGAA